MGIVNAGLLPVYDDIEPTMRNLIEAVILNQSDDNKHVERLIEFADNMKQNKTKKTTTVEKQIDEWRTKSVEERLKHSLIKVKMHLKFREFQIILKRIRKKQDRCILLL